MAKRLIPKAERVSIDPVTHECKVVVLDAVQNAFDLIHQCIDGRMLSLDLQERYKLADRLAELVRGMQHPDSASVVIH